MESLRTTLGKRIRAAREALGISQEELAARADLNTSYLSQIERGMKEPSLSVLERLADGVHLDLGELFERDPAAAPALQEREVARLLAELPEDKRKALLDLIRAGTALAR